MSAEWAHLQRSLPLLTVVEWCLKVPVNVVKEGVRDFIFRSRILNIEIYDYMYYLNVIKVNCYLFCGILFVLLLQRL